MPVELSDYDVMGITVILGICTALLVHKASSSFRERFDAKARVDSTATGRKESVAVMTNPQADRRAATEEAEHDPTRTVLIVDDDPLTRMQLRKHLERLKLKVKEVSDGPAAVQLYKEGYRFCMVVMDYEMPDMNGLITTRKIRSFDNDVVIIGSTIHDPATKQNEFLQAGANFVDIKPISADRLSEFVAEYNIAPAVTGK